MLLKTCWNDNVRCFQMNINVITGAIVSIALKAQPSFSAATLNKVHLSDKC